MITPSDQAIIQSTIRGFPDRDLIRSRGKEWSPEHIDYAISRLQQDTNPGARLLAEKYLLELRADRAREIALAEGEKRAAERQAATEATLAELLKAVEKGPKAHWSRTLGFWVAAIAAMAAVIAAWPVIRGWLH